SAAVAASVKAQWELLKQAGSIQRRILPVLTRVELSEKDKLDAARVHVRELFRPVMQLGPPDEEVYWSRAEIAYWPYYALEEVLAIFGDPFRTPTSLLVSCETFVYTLTYGEVQRAELPDATLREEVLAVLVRRAERKIVEGTPLARVLLSYSRIDGASFASD